MFRTALFSTTAFLGLTASAGLAAAHPPVVYRAPVIYPPPVVYPAPVVASYYPQAIPVHRAWSVVYRGCVAEPWRTYGSFRCEEDARHAAHHLRHSGYLTRVVCG